MKGYISVIPDNAKTTLDEVIGSPYVVFIATAAFSFALIKFSLADIAKRVEKLEESREKDRKDEHAWLEDKLKINNEILLGEINLRLSEIKYELKQNNEALHSRDRTLNDAKEAIQRIGEEAREAKYNAKLAVNLSCGNPPSNP
jgi:vacuolar-type H+-ATPase subunit I/STV1